MNSARVRRGSTIGVVLTFLALTAGGLDAGPAAADPTPAGPTPPTDPTQSAQVLANVERQLGERTPGGYLDTANRPVVTVTDDATAQEVSRSGAVPRRVSRSRATLDSAIRRLDAAPRTPGTMWSRDPESNQIVVRYDSTVPAASLQHLRQVAAGLGPAVRVEPLGGPIGLFISGGDGIYGRVSGGRAQCSLGLNVHVSGQNYFLTAGHCGVSVGTWYSNSSLSTTLGTTQNARFPGTDYALVRYTNTSVTVSGTVGSQDITSAGTPVVGQRVTRRGSRTGTHSGTVIGLDATVNYSEGTVRGLIDTTVCAEPGDSGGPLYSSTTALGLTSGGSGNCSSGGETFFQPVVPALNAYGASVF